MLILKDIYHLRHEIIRASIPLLIIFTGFLITYIYAPKGYYAAYKIILLILNGFVYFLFFISFTKSNKFNNLRLALFLIFIYIFLVKCAIQNNVIPSPVNIYDFGFIRYGLSKSIDSNVSFTHYHQFGAIGLFSVIFILSSIKKINWFYSFLIIFCAYLSLLAGARQMIYGIVGVIFIYFIINYKSYISGQIIFYVFFAVSLIIIFESTNIPFISDFLINKDVTETLGGRMGAYEQAIRIFQEKPFWGNGIGGFAFHGENRSYPHNIILEIMAEGGIFMLILIFLTLYIVKARSDYRLGNQTENGTLYLLIIVGFAVRSFSSSDLTENIALISALCAISVFKKVISSKGYEISMIKSSR